MTEFLICVIATLVIVGTGVLCQCTTHKTILTTFIVMTVGMTLCIGGIFYNERALWYDKVYSEQTTKP